MYQIKLRFKLEFPFLPKEMDRLLIYFSLYYQNSIYLFSCQYQQLKNNLVGIVFIKIILL